MKKLLFFALLLIGTIGAKADEITGALKVAADKQTATLHVSLTNELSYVAFQMDVTLPEGWTVTSAAPVGSSRLDGTGDGTAVGDTKFNLAYNVIGGNKLRVLAYNLANSVIQDVEGAELFTVELTKSGDAASEITDWAATFSNVLFVSKDAQGNLTENGMTVSNETVTGEADSVIGNVNKDNDVDTADIVALLDIVFYDADGSKNKYPQYDYNAADVNKDNSIDTQDIVVLVNIITNVNN